MDQKQIVILVSIVASLQICVTAAACNISPRFWCESEQTALECGVYEQCKNNEWTLRQDAAPVGLELYYESMCDGCKEFITTQLYPTYQKIPSIINITLIPYGNSDEKKVGDHWEFTCQHGEDECLGNLIETCTIAIVQKVEKYLPFINCIESSPLIPKDAATKCAPQFSIPLDQVLNCSTSDYGNQLEHQMGLKTESLVPNIEYVPWATLNGVYTEELEKKIQTNLLKVICDTYKGKKPPACSSV